MAGVSDADRAAVRRQARALAACESSDLGDDDSRWAAIAAADEDRRRSGRPPLKTEPELHRKAVARGLLLR